MQEHEVSRDQDLKAKILDILAANHVMAVATVRPDGWPQATFVGYVNDDLALYFATSRTSQKVANLAHDARISVAVGGTGGADLRGLSMAARAVEITDPREVARLNSLIAARWPEQAVFAPRGPSVALIRAIPEIISLVDPAAGLAQGRLLQVNHETSLSAYVAPDEAPETGLPSWTRG